ncbi:MAG: phosphomannomutase/phosphoglucomutase [Bacteroidales bacterium]|nr:phosphomannomutase/phosphoglucomutase [Bacteroidales bacterium]
MPINLKSLQNGSDIRGVASPGIPGEQVNLSPEIVEKIARAFVSWLSEYKQCRPEHLKVSIGRDSRITGPDLMKAFARGVLESGADTVDCGLSSTPAMFMSTVFEETHYDGAVMLTASHLPFNRNGVKFFTRDGGLDKPDIASILDKAGTIEEAPAAIPGREYSFDLIGKYSDFLCDSIRKGVQHPDHYNQPLLGFHIVVDAGNGSGGFFVDRVLQPLGANTAGSQFLDPDGNFPNHVPNPEDGTAMMSVQQAVLENHADIGIIFDTDVDRAAAVDQSGLLLNRNLLIALISGIILEEHPGTVIVTDSITSDGLATFINQDLKGIHHRFKRGYKNVINEAIRLNQEGRESWLAIETSGHAALKENFFLDDGAYLMTKILIKAARLRMEGKSYRNLTDRMTMPAESEEFRLKILHPDFKSYGNQVISDLREFVQKISGWHIVPENHEGIRVSCNPENGNGWFLLRLSLHDPVIPLNVESNVEGGVSLIMSQLSGFFDQYKDLCGS